MNLLAIDTSTEVASVAVLLGDKLFHEEQGSQKTHAQFILPMIDQLMHDSGLQMNQLDGIVFGCGPGSFTGLRIACSIAKGLAYAHDLDLIPVSSLSAVVWAARQETTLPVLAVLDARMHELYWAYYAPEQLVAEERVNAASEIILPHEQSFVLAGVGIDTYWMDFPEALKEKISTQINVHPNAAAMLQLARTKVIQSVSAANAQPVYVRNQVTYSKKP
ncbi:MAG: tRNA (adenosine(37)-N6)-threonylcarbamoyltransferase complex dimerization subunit type 1 TsaB [Legionella sp.]|nr:tRNA (adenosine(37)-N6)-threonylcarbamoyltransferase complex dimerization subunit type 1 TsaB [Legionella sp.]